MKSFITKSPSETKKLGEGFARKVRHGGIIALQGGLGSGKTTFTQGFLKKLGVKGPYTSPTFVIMKKYKNNIYHFDAYRVKPKDILNLGWEEIILNKNNIIIIEWADRIKKIIPKSALRINFKWMDENKRKIIFTSSRACREI